MHWVQTPTQHVSCVRSRCQPNMYHFWNPDTSPPCVMHRVSGSDTSPKFVMSQNQTQAEHVFFLRFIHQPNMFPFWVSDTCPPCVMCRVKTLACQKSSIGSRQQPNMCNFWGPDTSPPCVMYHVQTPAQSVSGDRCNSNATCVMCQSRHQSTMCHV